METSCECCNVKVYIESPITLTDLVLTTDELSHEFFSKALYKVKAGGCQETQSYLIKSQIVGSWNIRQCLVCNLYTHAISYKNGDIICSSELSEKPHNISESANFSKVYRILMPTSFTYNDNIDILSNQLSIAEQEVLLTIQRQATAVVDKMGQKVENNIEAFVDKQRQVLSDIKMKADLDANILYQLFIDDKRKMEIALESNSSAPLESEIENTYDGAANLDYQDSPNYKLNTFTVPIAEEELEDSIEKDLFELLPPEERPQESKDAAGIFEMDEFISSNSDKDKHERESSETSDNEVPVFSPISARTRKVFESDIAKSAPVNVPVWGAISSGRRVTLTKSPADVQEIAESIQNLAKSVRLSSADVFGELPPPRKPKEN